MQSKKNNTLFVSFIIILIFSFQNVYAQKLLKIDNPKLSIQNRWEQAIKKIDQEQVWIGYSIKQLMGKRCYYGNSETHKNSPSLQDVILGKVDIQAMSNCNDERHFHMSDDENVEKELKDVGILILVNKNKIIKEVDLNNLSLPFNLHNHSLYWLGEAKEDESVDLLKNIFSNESDPEIKEDLITAIGIHDNNVNGFNFLKDIIFSKENNEVREQAVFWLARHNNPEVLQLMKKIANEDYSEDVREQAVFGLYLIDSDESTDELIKLARHSQRKHIRKQAIFWLGQTASKKAFDVINDVIYDEEETEIQSHAVFALSQLDTENSIASLIKVAQTHPNPKVRKKAIFWLGQTEDERALDAIIGFLKN